MNSKLFSLKYSFKSNSNEQSWIKRFAVIKAMSNRPAIKIPTKFVYSTCMSHMSKEISLNIIPIPGPNANPTEYAAAIFQMLPVAWWVTNSLTVSPVDVLENVSPAPAINLPTKR